MATLSPRVTQSQRGRRALESARRDNNLPPTTTSAAITMASLHTSVGTHGDQRRRALKAKSSGLAWQTTLDRRRAQQRKMSDNELQNVCAQKKYFWKSLTWMAAAGLPRGNKMSGRL